MPRKSIPGKVSRHCAASGCSNGDYVLMKWAKEICEIHNITKESCECTPPFEMFNFPTKLKNLDERKRWISLINRLPSSRSNKLWSPKKGSRVCSHHFIHHQLTDDIVLSLHKILAMILKSELHSWHHLVLPV